MSHEVRTLPLQVYVCLMKWEHYPCKFMYVSWSENITLVSLCLTKWEHYPFKFLSHEVRTLPLQVYVSCSKNITLASLCLMQ